MATGGTINVIHRTLLALAFLRFIDVLIDVLIDMLMRMMAEMVLRGHAHFVLAILGHRSKAPLNWQNANDENRDEFAHGANYARYAWPERR